MINGSASINLKVIFNHINNLTSEFDFIRDTSFHELERFFANPLLNIKEPKIDSIIERLHKYEDNGCKHASKLLGLILNTDFTDDFFNSKDYLSIESIVLDLGIKRKELLEASSFYNIVAPIFKKYHSHMPKRIVDFCSGNGINSIIWTLANSDIYSNMVDIKQNKNFLKLLSRISELDRFSHENRLEQRLNYSLNGIEGFNLNYEIEDFNQVNKNNNLFFISVHCCGDLADKIITKALNYGVNFAIMPCCYEINKNTLLPNSLFYHFSNPREIIDALRINKITSYPQKKYDVFIRDINPDISPYNRIIIGLTSNLEQ
jgi:hypothetical protein